MLLAEQAREQRANPDRRLSLRRESDLAQVKKSLAIGLLIVAGSSFLMGYLLGSGTLDHFKQKPETPAITQKEPTNEPKN